MPELPRYENMGVQYADLPRISTAPQQVRAQGLADIGAQIDRITSFFQQEAAVEAKRKGMQYALENPITNEQLMTAISTKQPIDTKIPGAGRIFQESYNEAQGASLRGQLQADIQNTVAAYAAKLEAGVPLDLDQVKKELRDKTDGFSTAVMSFSPTQAIQLRASAATSGAVLIKAAADYQIKLFKAQENQRLEDEIRTQTPLIRLTLDNASDMIDPTTGKPPNLDKMMENIMRPFHLAAKSNPDAKKYSDKMYETIRTETKNYLANHAMNNDFADNDITRNKRITAGDFGNKSAIWKSLSNEEQNDVSKMVGERIDAINKARTSFLNSQNFEAEDTLRKLYLSTSMNDMEKFYKQLSGFAVDPAKLKAAREYINHLKTQGPVADNLNELARITRSMAAGEATVNDVISASNRGLLTRATSKTLVMNIANPSDDVNRADVVLRSAVNIQAANIPPEIPTAEGKAAAVRLYNTNSLALRTYASTPNEKGQFPTPADIKNRANDLAAGMKTEMSPLFVKAADQKSAEVRMQLPAELKTVNLDNDAEFNQAIAAAQKAKRSQPSISAAIAARREYLNLKKQAQ